MGWVQRNPARILRPPKLKQTHTLPFDPAEMAEILVMARQVRLKELNNRRLEAIVLVMRCSGLRISDAAMLTTDRFRGPELFLYTQKSGTHVYVPLPPFVMEKLDALKLRQNKYYFLGAGSMRMETVTDTWRKRLDKVFEMACIPNGHPHRFRHYAEFRTMPSKLRLIQRPPGKTAVARAKVVGGLGIVRRTATSC